MKLFFWSVFKPTPIKMTKTKNVNSGKCFKGTYVHLNKALDMFKSDYVGFHSLL